MPEVSIETYESGTIHDAVNTTVIYMVERADPAEVFNHIVEFAGCAPVIPILGQKISIKGSGLEPLQAYTGEVGAVSNTFEEDSEGFHQTIRIKII